MIPVTIWHSLDLAETYRTLSSGPTGSTSPDAGRRPRDQGSNIIERVRGDEPMENGIGRP